MEPKKEEGDLSFAGLRARYAWIAPAVFGVSPFLYAFVVWWFGVPTAALTFDYRQQDAPGAAAAPEPATAAPAAPENAPAPAPARSPVKVPAEASPPAMPPLPPARCAGGCSPVAVMRFDVFNDFPLSWSRVALVIDVADTVDDGKQAFVSGLRWTTDGACHVEIEAINGTNSGRLIVRPGPRGSDSSLEYRTGFGITLSSGDSLWEPRKVTVVRGSASHILSMPLDPRPMRVATTWAWIVFFFGPLAILVMNAMFWWMLSTSNKKIEQDLNAAHQKREQELQTKMRAERADLEAELRQTKEKIKVDAMRETAETLRESRIEDGSLWTLLNDEERKLETPPGK